MTAQAFPALGFDPAPGDPAAARDLARTIGLLAHEVGAAASTLSGADSQDWTGLHADAFRAHLHQDVLPLVRTVAGSFGRAAAALGTWGRLLEGFAAEAVILERRARAAQQDAQAVTRSLAAFTAAHGKHGAWMFCRAGGSWRVIKIPDLVSAVDPSWRHHRRARMVPLSPTA